MRTLCLGEESGRKALNSYAATLFRVDQRFLTRHSPIFADMFALPSGTEKREEYDGVPIVHLPQDDAEDVTSMLQAIYNG